MEYARLWAPITVLMFMLAGFFCYSYLEKVDKANGLFQTVKLTTQQAQDSLAGRLKVLEVRQRIAKENSSLKQKLHAAEARLKSAEDTIAGINARQLQAKADVEGLIEWLTKSRSKFRDELQSGPPADMTLSSGRVFVSAQIRKIDQDTISIGHADGISSVTAKDLSEVLVAKLDLGDNSLLSRLQQFHASVSGMAPATEAAKTSTKAVVVRSSSGPALQAAPVHKMALADEARLAALERRQSELQDRMKIVKQNEQASLQAKTNLSYQIEIQKARGVPTTRLQEQLQEAKVAAEIATADLQTMRAELDNIALEISQLSGKDRK